MALNSDVLRVRFDDAASSGGEVRMQFCANDEIRSVYFRSADVVLEKRPEALVAAGILPAMRSGKDLQLDSVLDPVFEKNLENIQNLFEAWGPSYRRVNVRGGAEQPALPQPGQKRVGLFFSGGVDSFYTLLEHQDEVTDLIFVHGFDIRPEDRESCRRAEESIRRVGESFGKRVIKIETDLRAMLDDYGNWGERTHGAAMAAVAHLIAGEFARIYIAASYATDPLFPWGSHPHLDPLWSSSGLEFVHDGCDTNRSDKLRRVSLSDIALKNLRVCWKNRKGSLNCGRCEKCIRTMIGLNVLGVLNRTNVFCKPLRFWRVMGVKIPHPDVEASQFYNLAELKKEPKFRVLYWALCVGFFRSRLRCRIKMRGKNSRG